MQIDPHAPGDSYEGAGADRQLVVQVCVCVSELDAACGAGVCVCVCVLELDAACGAGVLPDALTRRL
jgi:hypothetical protein